MAGRWVWAAHRRDVVPTRGLRVDLGSHVVALFEYAGAVYAIDNACPHHGASLGMGRVEDGVVACPLHWWKFRVSDGAWLANPDECVATYPVRVEGNAVFVELPPPTLRDTEKLT